MQHVTKEVELLTFNINALKFAPEIDWDMYEYDISTVFLSLVTCVILHLPGSMTAINRNSIKVSSVTSLCS